MPARHRSRSPRWLTLLAVTAVAGACELTSVELADADDTIVAEVYLRPGDSLHHAFVHRTLRLDGGDLRVDGATIRVTGPGGVTLDFAPVGNAVCLGDEVDDRDVAGSCYVAEDGGRVQAGDTYELAIRLPDGRRIDGRTTVPAPFQVLRPAPDTCLVEDTSLQLLWTRAAGAWAYQADALFTGLAEGLAARGVTDPPDTLRLVGLAVGAADTTMTFPRDFGVFDRFQVDLEVMRALQQGLPEGATADIVLAAADRNYVNWVRGGNFNPSGQVRISSLTGDGVGVFGSLLGHSRRLLAAGTAIADTLPPCE
jgi:hypothetical protein